MDHTGNSSIFGSTQTCTAEPTEYEYSNLLDYHLNGTNNTHKYSTSRQVTRVLTSYILPTICCLGIIGNSLILVVLTRYRVRRTVTTSEKVIHAGLLIMAVSDLLLNICVLPLAFVPEGSLLLPAGSFRLFYNLYGTGFITTFSLCSTWLIVVTAGLRYVGVCHPLRARYLITRQATFTIIGVICAMCVLGNTPQFWLHKATPFYGDANMVIIDVGPFSHQHTRGIAYSWIRAFFAIFIPGLLLIYFNIRLLVALHASRRLHEDHVLQSALTTRRESGNSNRLTRTLIAVIVMFIVLVYPDSLFDFFMYIAPIRGIKNNEHVIIARAVVNLLQICNYAFNFILYCVMNASFRRALRGLICWCVMAHARSEHPGQITNHCQKFLHPLLIPEFRFYETSTDAHRIGPGVMGATYNHASRSSRSTSCTNM